MKHITFFILLTLFFVPEFVSAKTLAVPFTSQAPDANWNEPWFNACEEATLAMVDAWYNQLPLTKASAKSMIKNIIGVENSLLGFNKDTGALDTAKIISSLFTWHAHVVETPTTEQIKKEIDAGRPVIIPVYGRGLKNPYFSHGGPIYHMLLISGYDDSKNEFITQEPGTRRGLDFRYPYDRLMGAIHDFVPKGKTKTGKQIVLFTSPAQE